jgi:hypothetical protein
LIAFFPIHCSLFSTMFQPVLPFIQPYDAKYFMFNWSDNMNICHH